MHYLLVQNPTFPLFCHHFFNLLDISDVPVTKSGLLPHETCRFPCSLACLDSRVLPVPTKPCWFALSDLPILAGELPPFWCHTWILGNTSLFCQFSSGFERLQCVNLFRRDTIITTSCFLHHRAFLVVSITVMRSQ